MLLLGVVTLTFFIVGLCLLLRRAEGEPAWRSTVALVFGALFAAYLFTNTSLSAAGNRGADLDPGLAHFAFDMGNLGFALAERIRSTATLASTPTTVAAPPAISAHRGPALSATQPRIGEPIAVPPNSTMM